MNDFVEPSVVASRRERNKAATRDAIAHAAFDLLGEVGYEHVTIGMITDRADVSRRTFFNYFSSLDEAFNVRVTDALDRAIEEFDKYPLDQPLMETAISALHVLADQQFLESIALLYAQCEKSPSLTANHYAAWETSSHELTQRLLTRFPHTDPFALSVFSNTVIGASKAAFSAWHDTLGEELTPHDTAVLKEKLTTAMEIVKDGFPTIVSVSHAKGH
ncbi:TetR/AcrR family transcriptional regulator [Timonella sp. A28]|uniref:TetR/AcrR family transcriptional regulator n=1 Tax=Timonella sp. A28 TaxID=3442640 RepID=UPI003EBBC050